MVWFVTATYGRRTDLNVSSETERPVHFILIDSKSLDPTSPIHVLLKFFAVWDWSLKKKLKSPRTSTTRTSMTTSWLKGHGIGNRHGAISLCGNAHDPDHQA